MVGVVQEAIGLPCLPPALPAVGCGLGFPTLSCKGPGVPAPPESAPGWYHSDSTGELLSGSPSCGVTQRNYCVSSEAFLKASYKTLWRVVCSSVLPKTPRE